MEKAFRHSRRLNRFYFVNRAFDRDRPALDNAHPTALALSPTLAGWALVLLAAAAFLVRIWGVSRLHSWDEMVYLQDAQVICCGKINYSELSFRPLLLSLIYAGVFLLWRSVYAVSVVTALINALAPVLLYLGGRRVVGRFPAAIAALLLAFGPFFVGIFPDGFDSDDTGNSLLTDSPALTLVLMAFWLLVRALERERPRPFVWAGFALAMSILMRFGSLPSVGMLCLLPLVAKQRWSAITACGVGLAGVLMPYLLWSRMKFGGFLFTLRAGWAHVEGPEESHFYFIRHISTIFTPVAVIGLLLCALFWLACLLVPNFRSGLRIPFPSAADPSPLVLQLFLWLWLIGDFVFFSAIPHKEPRYIMPLVPPFLLLAGSGLWLLCSQPRNKALRHSGILVVTALLIYAFLPLRARFSNPFIDPEIPEEMLASEYLNSSLPPGTILYMSFNYPAFAFYTNFRIHELPAAGEALHAAIEQIPPGGIFIAYRDTEAREPEIDWANANPQFRCLRDFSAFLIYLRLPGAVPESFSSCHKDK